MYIQRYNKFFRIFLGTIQSMKIEYFKPKYVTENGQIKIIEIPIDGADIKCEEFEYHNNKLKEYYIERGSEIFSGPFRIEYTYNSKGLIDKEFRKSYKKGVLDFSYELIHVYDYQERTAIRRDYHEILTQYNLGRYKVFYYNSDWKIIRTQKFKAYDTYLRDNDLIIEMKEFTKGHFSGSYELDRVTYFNYFDNKNLEKIHFDSSDDNYTFEYSYDQYNNWIKAYCYENKIDDHKELILIINRSINYQ